MNKIDLRYAIQKGLLGKYGPEGVESADLVGPDPGEPGVVIEVVTDDPYNVTDPMAVRRFRVTVEEIES
ncbi:hypothetical protein ACFW2V_13615 [Streptomyces sp. NPDC058947]|uniref:hypothetical protein n=1 Tax=Streptomyces sp. NPDC058947 TaxID=3346675 RepID=UPI003674271A